MSTHSLTAPPPVSADLLLVDARAPRANQAVVAVLSLVAVATGAWPILGVLAAQLLISVVFGRAYCLACVIYFRFVQPRFGSGPLEDSRAPRFANVIGTVVLSAATLAYALGAPRLGFGLGALVAGLASLAAVSGLCVGCELYRVIARVRGVRGQVLERVDLEGLGVPSGQPTTVLFTHPLCSECQTVAGELEQSGRSFVKIDVSQRRDLAKKYGVRVVPLVVSVQADGRVAR